MPRRGGKKKKGKMIRPGQEMAVAVTTKALEDTLKGFGLGAALGGGITGAASDAKTTTADENSSSVLDVSQYTYYSESVN